MTDSWKIGAISGLIAGIVAGLISSTISLYAFRMDMWFISLFPTSPVTPLKIVVTEFGLGIIWGIMLGIIYSKIFDLIPGKARWKGIVYALGFCLIFNIRIANIAASYAFLPDAILYIIGILTWITYGFVLGILFKSLQDKYQIPKEELKIEKYNLRGGIFPGAIAGIIAGIIVFLGFFVNSYIGIFEWIPEQWTDIGFMIGVLGSHMMIGMFWFAIFGMIYAMFYERIPGKGLMRGLYFGLILFIITDFRVGIYILTFGNIISAYAMLGFHSILSWAGGGLMLGYLYRKPSD